MADQQHNRPKDQPSLADISHLFLSSVRDKQIGAGQRPQRTPPKPIADVPIELTIEEFAQALASDSHEISRQPAVRSRESNDHRTPITAVIAPHLNGQQRHRVREYAASLCKSGERIGLIEIDASEFRVSCFELGSEQHPFEPSACEALDGRRMTEALEELSWDVDRWLINLPNPRSTEARGILRMIPRWTVLATCDHDGVVACYRSLKGLSELHPHQDDHGSPVLSLALLAVRDELEAMRVFRKLANVCQQFLHWPLESESPVQAAGSVVEHQVLECRATRDKAQLATAPQWQIVADFFTKSVREMSGSCRIEMDKPAETPAALAESAQVAPTRAAQSPGVPVSMDAPAAEPAVQMASDESSIAASGCGEVIDLPAGVDSAAAIVSATLKGGADLVELTVKPPMLADASLAVARDRRLILLAVARQGLNDLRLIGEAWRWINENRALIAMAVPQLSIDPHQLPHLRLLVDRADMNASTLQPLLQSGNVTVHTYRKLRWGQKTGLLLEAA